MINKFIKFINNKFSTFFKFVFFLRFLLLIFFVAGFLLLIIPQFFDYKKKELIVKNYLSQNYGLKIKTIDNISFKSLPLPHLQIDNLTGNFITNESILKTQKVTIYPKLFSIYNYNNFHVRKVNLENNYLEIDFKDLKSFSQSFINLKKKISIQNLSLKIKDLDKDIIKLKNMTYFNYGYKKNIIDGEVFNKNFEISLKEDLSKVNFFLSKTGVSAKITVLKNDRHSLFNGSVEGKILKSSYKLFYFLKENFIKIDDFYFRDKNLSFNSNGYLSTKPFFKINLFSEIKHLNIDIIKSLDIKNLFKSKNLIKKLNIQNDIIFQPKRFSKNIVNELNIKSSLAYGRLNFSKKILISKSKLTCDGNLNLLEEYPIIYFYCNIKSPDMKDLLKKINVNYSKKNEVIDLDIQGNLNILNNKINFDKITMNENYKASNIDLKYFKSTFEKIIFNKDFIDMFDLKKIRSFIYEIS